MSILYINDYGIVVGMSDGRCKATLQEQCIASIPLEQLEGIVILGQAQLTTALTEYCLLNGIAVSYFSRGGTYFGKLESAAHVVQSVRYRICTGIVTQSDYGKNAQSTGGIEAV